MKANQDWASQVAQLQARLTHLEDLEAIRQLLASYGPAVDSNRLDDAAELWQPEGRYSVAGFGSHTGRAALHDLLAAPHHQQLVADGCAHLLSAPQIALKGDTAVAINHSCVLRWSGQHYQVERVAANRWVLQKSAVGWQVSERSNALLDGTQAAHALLRAPELDGLAITPYLKTDTP